MRELGINLGARIEMDVPTFCAHIRELGFTRVFSGSTDPDKVRRQAEEVHAAGLCYDTLHAPFKGIMNAIWQEGDEGEETLRQLMTCVDLLPSLCSFLFTAVAVNTIGATRTAVLGALEPVTAVLIGLLVFGESIPIIGFFAIAIIIISVIIVVCGKSASSPTSGNINE